MTAEKKINDGGPAFPRQSDQTIRGAQGYQSGENGMSLRDWFAGKALSGFLGDHLLSASLDSNCGEGNEGAETNARWAYQLADAMIAEREKRPWSPSDAYGQPATLRRLKKHRPF
jgi:hypothetical protein